MAAPELAAVFGEVESGGLGEGVFVSVGLGDGGLELCVGLAGVVAGAGVRGHVEPVGGVAAAVHPARDAPCVGAGDDFARGAVEVPGTAEAPVPGDWLPGPTTPCGWLC